ncbi:MAG: GNAT family N-acetyltransferase [Clostridia bacterium]|nr:GNAT family N-acetyltransferase [Clostridia bacterium]
MLNKLKEFYFNHTSCFSERFEKDGIQFLFSKYVKDHYSNIAVVDSSSNLSLAEAEFKERNLNPSYYSFEKPTKDFEITYTDDFLFLEDITLLYKKFSRFKSKHVSLQEVCSKELENEFQIINNDCYSDLSAENPYPDLDNFAYSNSVLEYKKHETETTTKIYIIKFNKTNVGCINITIKKDLCYISGLAILKEYRKTKVFSVLVDILKILIDNNVKSIFCVTELDGYPDQLYKKLGFKSLGVAYGYKNKTFKKEKL